MRTLVAIVLRLALAPFVLLALLCALCVPSCVLTGAGVGVERPSGGGDWRVTGSLKFSESEKNPLQAVP